MKKVLFILAIFFIGFQNILAQENIENKKDSIYKFVPIKAEFIGGDKALFNFWNSEITYPECVEKNDVVLKMYVNFIIRKDGSVDDVKVIRNIKFRKQEGTEEYYECTKWREDCEETGEYKECVELLKKEAIRVIEATNKKWKAGKNMKETIVSSYFTLPINFFIKK